MQSIQCVDYLLFYWCVEPKKTQQKTNVFPAMRNFLKETFNNSCSEKRYNLHLYQAIDPQNGHLSYVVYITYWVLPPTFTFCNNISRWHGAVKLSKSININLHISVIIIIKIILNTINFYLYIFSINIYITQNRKL